MFYSEDSRTRKHIVFSIHLSMLYSDDSRTWKTRTRTLEYSPTLECSPTLEYLLSNPRILLLQPSSSPTLLSPTRGREQWRFSRIQMLQMAGAGCEHLAESASSQSRLARRFPRRVDSPQSSGVSRSTRGHPAAALLAPLPSSAPLLGPSPLRSLQPITGPDISLPACLALQYR